MTFTIGRDAVKYSDARQICQERNGDLTSIKDEDEQNFIANTVISEPDDYWIGLDDTWSEGDFEWVDRYLFIQNRVCQRKVHLKAL